MRVTFSLPENWLSLAREFGTPLSLIDAGAVRSQIATLQSAFAFASIHYSMKANHNPALIRLIAKAGIGMDVVSPLELELALHCGVPASRIIYIENNMTDAEMARAVQSGARLVIGSMTRLKRFAECHPGASCGIRINGDIGAAQHVGASTGGPRSKFGIHYSLMDAAFALAKAHGVVITLLHQHIGSGWLSGAHYSLAADRLIEIAARFDTINTLDFGGGFGIAYASEDHPLDPQLLGSLLYDRLQRFTAATRRSLAAAIEPGRYITGPCGALLIEVQDVKSVPGGTTFIGTNSGFNHLIRPALYGVAHRITNLTAHDGPAQRYTVVGNICESTDVLATDVMLPPTQVGDILMIHDYGAYGAAMASPYNLRPPPAELMIDGDTARLTRRRADLSETLLGFEL
jgi:diaminopimelate decarboxylase